MLPLLYMPDRSKQQARRLPQASLSQAVAMRLGRVSAFLPEVIQWITSGKKAETRDKRIVVACDKLASGSRRACCFDRSGMYSKAFSAPRAAE